MVGVVSDRPVMGEKSMRKSLNAIAAALIACSMPFAGASAKETGISDFIDDFCKPQVDAGTYASVGECMGQNRQALVDFCKDNYAAMGFKNHGGCEKWAQDQIKNNDY